MISHFEIFRLENKRRLEGNKFMAKASNFGNNRKYIKSKDGKFAGSVPSSSAVAASPTVPSKASSGPTKEQSPKEISIAYAKYILTLSPVKQKDALSEVENPFILHETAKRTEDPDLRTSIVNNPNAKSFTLMYLINRDETPSVREGIINNPNCDEAVITKWFRNANRTQMAEVLSPGHIHYDKVPGHVLSRIEKRQMGHSAAPEDPAEQATMAGLAAHPNTPANTLRNLTRRFPVKYGRELIGNPNLPNDAWHSVVRTNRWQHKFDKTS